MVVAIRNASASKLFVDQQDAYEDGPFCVPHELQTTDGRDSWDYSLLELRSESNSSDGGSIHSGRSTAAASLCEEGDAETPAACAMCGTAVCRHDVTVPAYLRRAFMYTGYPTAKTHSAALRQTLLSWNNQTLNCWTMIFGVLCSWVALTHSRREFDLLGARTLPLWILFASAVAQTLVSVCFHCFIGISQPVRDFWRTADVSVIMIGMGVRSTAMAMCMMSRATSSLHLAALATATLAALHTCAYGKRPIKDLSKATIGRLMAAMSFAYFSPTALSLTLGTWSGGLAGTGMLLGAAALHSAGFWGGGAVYALHWPERCLPGKLDLVLNSHQIMHALATLAHVCEYWLCVEMCRQATGALLAGGL